MSGAYTDARVDADNNGEAEALRITVGVNVTAAAAYQVVGWLQSSTGTDLAWAYATANLSPGAQQVQLDFDGKLLRLQGVNGPYKLAHVELRTGDDGDVVDFADNAYTHCRVRREQLCSACGCLSRARIPTAVSTATATACLIHSM